MPGDSELIQAILKAANARAEATKIKNSLLFVAITKQYDSLPC